MKNLNKLYKLFNRFRKDQIIVLCLILFKTLLTALGIFYIKYLIDAIIGHEPWNRVLELGIFILSITIINIIVQIMQNYIWHKLRHKAINYLRMKMFRSAIYKSVDFFQKNSIGETLAKVMDDVIIVAQHASIGIPMLIANVLRLIVVLTALFVLNIKLGFIVVLTLPIYYLVFNYLNKQIRKASAVERKNYGNVMKDAQEKLQGINTIKIFGKEEYILNNFKETLSNYFFFVKRLLYFTSCGTGLTIVIMHCLPVVILLFGGNLAYKGEISVGTLMAFYTFLSLIYEPVVNLSDYNLGLQTTLGFAERILGFLEDTEEENEDGKNIDEIESIEFKEVYFSYSGDKDVLRNISFKIEKGDRVCIIGPSGSGKSTLLNLIMKFYEPTKGNILINGIKLSEINKKSYYKKISLMQQIPFLFNGSIKENITFGEDYSEQKLEFVSRICCILDLVNSFKERFEHIITESGSNLSGGERQRICLARTLIRDSQLIILDEASSSLDSAIEKEIVSNIGELIKKSDKILIAVSHKPEILSICNKVIRIEDGKIVNITEDANEIKMMAG